MSGRDLFGKQDVVLRSSWIPDVNLSSRTERYAMQLEEEADF